MRRKDTETADLFSVPWYGEARARRTDPSTSKEAAAILDGVIAGELDKKIVKALRENPAGLTYHEISSITGLRNVCASPRLRPLVRKNLVYDSGEKRVEESTNKKCIVWKAVI